MPTDAQYHQLAMDFLTKVGRELARFYPVLLERAWDDASALTGVDLVFDLAMPEVQEVLDQLLTAESLQGIGDSLIETARSLISQQASEGWSTDELARQLRARGVTDSVSRSKAISRTETARAYSAGSVLAYEQSGVVSELEWLTAPESCDICDPLDGTRAALDGTFAGGIPYPPAHPLCRCAIAPVVGA